MATYEGVLGIDADSLLEYLRSGSSVILSGSKNQGWYELGDIVITERTFPMSYRDIRTAIHDLEEIGLVFWDVLSNGVGGLKYRAALKRVGES